LLNPIIMKPKDATSALQYPILNAMLKGYPIAMTGPMTAPMRAKNEIPLIWPHLIRENASKERNRAATPSNIRVIGLFMFLAFQLVIDRFTRAHEPVIYPNGTFSLCTLMILAAYGQSNFLK